MIFRKRKTPGRVLLIHIGDHKTGSTTIQNTFAKGCVQIEGESPCYPTDLHHNYMFALLSAHYGDDKPKKFSRQHAQLSKLATRLGSSDARYNLISGEMMERTKPAHLKRFIDEYLGTSFDTVRIIAYVRPHAERILSGYAESTKLGKQSNLKSFANGITKSKRLFYAPRFQAWRDLFGENFVLRPMIRGALNQGDLLTDFIQNGFGTDDFTIAPFDDDNQSLNLKDLMLLKALHSRVDIQNKSSRHAVGREIGYYLSNLPSESDSGKPQLHKELAQSIADQYIEDARAVDETFFDGQPLLKTALQKATEKAASTAVSTDPVDYFSADELRNIYVLGDVFNMMLNAGDTDWAAVFQNARVNALHKS